MTTSSLESFSEKNRLYVELLRDPDNEARDAALAETAGRLDDELATEILRLLRHSHDSDFRLRLLENLSFELEAGPVEDADDDPEASVPASGHESWLTIHPFDPRSFPPPGEPKRGTCPVFSGRVPAPRPLEEIPPFRPQEGIQSLGEPEGGPLQIGFSPSPSAERGAGGRGPEIAAGLSRWVYGELRDFLRAFFEDPGQRGRLRRKALEVSALAPEPWHEAVVRECWLRPEPEWRVTALFCMGHLFPVDFAEEIAEGLASSENALRSQAISAADSRGLRSLGPRILRLAAERGNDLEVRLCAIEALANLRPPGSARLLAKLRAEPAPFGNFAANALVCLEENERAEALLEGWKAEAPRALPPTVGPAQWDVPRLIDSRFL